MFRRIRNGPINCDFAHIIKPEFVLEGRLQRSKAPAFGATILARQIQSMFPILTRDYEVRARTLSIVTNELYFFTK